MPLTETPLFYVLVGVLCGVLSGSFGIGSGVVLVPILVHFAYSQKAAQGMALALMIPMAIVGVIRYQLSPHVDLRWTHVAWLSLGGIAGAYLGTGIALGAADAVLRKAFAVFLFLVSLKMFFSK
jgi:uncharacterized membrane protein YfcA